MGSKKSLYTQQTTKVFFVVHWFFGHFQWCLMIDLTWLKHMFFPNWTPPGTRFGSDKIDCKNMIHRHILLGTNISHLWKRKIIFPATFNRDMLVPWRVYPRNPRDPFVCPRKGIEPGILWPRDGMLPPSILFDREVFGFLGICKDIGSYLNTLTVDNEGWEGSLH